ncbi:MAG: HEAT repeat domain-containing protein [Terriglobales bacterium]
MVLFEDLTSVVLWLLATVAAINLVFLFFVFFRRLVRKRYYAIKDSARERYQAVIAGFESGQVPVENATELLAGATTRPERDAVEELLLDAVLTGDPERMTELILGAGYMERWAAQAFGRRRGREVLRAAIHRQTPRPRSAKAARYIDPILRTRILSVPRAIATDHLGWAAPELARAFIAEALKDPSLEVRSTAISVIGRNGDRQAIPLLVDELARAVGQKSEISLRSIKVALVSYELDDLPYFVPYLTHEMPRVRFFVTDAMSQICNNPLAAASADRHDSSRRSAVRLQSASGRISSSRHRSGSRTSASRISSRGLLLNKNDFSRAFYEVFLSSLVKDDFADVRARSAGVIRHFRDRRTVDALRSLVRDENEFVRLHAARASGDRAYASLAAELARLLTDPKWRVREAAAQSLRASGKDGIGELYRRFVTTDDRYAAEQITEEIQRSGAIEDLAASLITSNATLPLSEAVCRKMIVMGKSSLLLNAMASAAVPGEARAFIMNAMQLAPPPEFFEILQQIAMTDTGPLGMKASSLLETPSTRSRAAASGVDLA